MAERLLDRNYFCLDLKKMIKKEKNWKDFQFLCVYTMLSMYTGLWLTFYQDMFQFQIQVPVTTACVALKKFAGYEDKGKRGLVLMTVKGHIWYLDQEYILISNLYVWHQKMLQTWKTNHFLLCYQLKNVRSKFSDESVSKFQNSELLWCF